MNIKDIMYVSSGNFITSEKRIHPNRYIDTHEIIFMTEGKAYIQENERKYCLSPGDILYLEPRKNHKGYMYNKKIETIIPDSKMLSTGNMILISDICEYIKNNTDKKIKVKDIADYFGYNESYLSRIFKGKYNMGIKQYINAEKIKYAKSLLITTQYPIKK